MSIEDRVALVTGAAGGLGRALVAGLADAGWVVAGATHRKGQYAADLERPAEARRLVARVVGDLGRLDLLIANHAAMTLAPVEEHPLEDWWRVVDTNLGGSFHLARAAAPHLRLVSGAILFISSEWGITGWPRASAYAASKAGLVGLTKALARELAPNVRVNALAPGVIDTPQLAVDAAEAGLTLAEMKDRYASVAPQGRIASPEEVAATAVFLASPAASHFTGQVLQPNGGTTMAT